MPEAQVVRSGDRFVTTVPFAGPGDGPGAAILSRHAFSFGDHYDPDNIGFGPLTAVNEELVAPGQGFAAHRHSDVEIVTWVLDGALEHQDSVGNRGVIRPGEVQHLSAGRGVEHTERNASSTDPLRFIQMNLVPSQAQLHADPLPPAYQQRDVEGARGRLIPALRVRDGVELAVAFLDPGDVVTVPAGGLRHLHVVRGQVDLAAIGVLDAGDSARVTSAGRIGVAARTRAEVLVWQLSS